MSVTEIIHGRGTPMTLRELCVGWPAYFHRKALIREREQARAESRGRTLG